MKRLLIICFCLFNTLAHADNSKTIVFVHGAWSGGWDWKDMQVGLQEKGYSVFRPTLTGLGERSHLSGPDVNLSTHIADIVNVLRYEELNNVVLVGHSYGGMVITGVANQEPDRIHHLVYLDAALPNDGESVFSMMGIARSTMLKGLAMLSGESWALSPQWENPGRHEPHPLATYEEPISIDDKALAKLAGTYVLTIDPGETEDNFTPMAKRAEAKGWRVLEWRTGHVPHRSMRDETIKLIIEASQ
jgi:pimeloyl-ACP methyl ester carboxylesterase